MYIPNDVFLPYQIRVSIETKLCNCLNINETLAWNRHDIWKLSDRNGT